MNEYGKHGLTITDKSPKQELLNVTEEKLECTTDNHEKIKQIIAKGTEEAKESFQSIFNEILIKQEQLKEQQAKHRVQIDSMMKTFIEDAKKSVAKISRNISGHGSSMNLAEKYIKERQKETEDREKKIVKEIKETEHPIGRRILDASQKVNATKMIQETKQERPKNSKKTEKHVTFALVEPSSLKTFKHRQAKVKPRMMDTRHQGNNLIEKSKNHETDVKKEKPQVQKTIKDKKLI